MYINFLFSSDTSTQNCDYINNKHFLTREKLQQDDYQQKTKLLLNDTFNKTQIVEVQEDKEGEQEEEPNFSIDMTNNDITTLLEADETSTIRSCPDFYQSQTSINIYDQPPVHSISQWANDELLKYMKI
ncbi:unnamed protein product [Adineta steineri]|uniref:Uncharacterized protein n=1 Tax=Adineta steineri TaxID=433720 RepID=A0A815GIQ1_9BILA|nr:unnamed protein product [Adineta steineri]CAF1592123.1 unnamed protein product [Adineta steineri]